MTKFRYILAFGSNLGDREKNARHAENALSECTQILRTSNHLVTSPLRSPFYDTSDHGDFLNYIMEVRSSFPPDLLYTRIAVIEDESGHDRSRRWASRVIDIDILLAAVDEDKPFPMCEPICQAGPLTIPHPELRNRTFLTKLLTVDFSFPDIDLRRLLKASDACE